MIPDQLERKNQSNRNAEWVALSIILFVAAGLRFFDYADFSYSNDELSAINRLQFNTFGELVRGGFFVDGHPGGIQVFLWYWSKWFGLSEASLRFPFVIFGILTVWLSYLVASKMFGRVAGLFTAATLTFLKFPLLYSQIARPYGSGLFFSLLMVYFWLRMVLLPKDKQRPGRSFYLDLFMYVIATSLCMYNHYFSFLFAIIVGITGLFRLKKPLLLPYIAGGILAAILFLPHLSITLNHLSYKGVGLWLGKPYPGWILEHLNYILNDSAYTIILITLVSIAISWQGKIIHTEKGMLRVALFWFIIPIIIGYSYSTLVSPVLQHPVLIFSFPYIIMLLFMGAGNVFGKVQQIILGVYLVLGVIGTVAVNGYYRSQHFGEFKGVAATTMKWEKELGGTVMEKIVLTNSPFYLDYYFDRMNYSTKFSLYALNEEQDFDRLDSLLTNSTKPYFLYACTKPAPEGVDDLIRSAYPKIFRSIQYGDFSKITLYSKNTGTFFEPGLELTLLSADSVFAGIHPIQSEEEADSSGYIFPLTADIEYSKAVEKELTEYSKWKAVKVVASVEAELADNQSQAMLVVSVESTSGKPVQWQSLHFDRTALAANCWGKVYKTLDMEGALLRGNKVKVYVWNQGKNFLKISHLKLEIYGFRNHIPRQKPGEIWGDTDK